MVDPYEHPRQAGLDAWTFLLAECALLEPLEPGFAQRFLDDGVATFAELGGGRGPVSRLLAAHGVDAVVVDLKAKEWDDLHRPAVVGDLTRLPFRSGSLGGASAVNCLYFLDDPTVGIAQAYDALAPGGLFLASAPSRYHDVELRDVEEGWGERSSFDAEEAAELVAAVFGDLEDVRDWEEPGYLLRDTHAVEQYLVAFGNPDAAERASGIATPVTVTKKGTDVWARKPSTTTS